VRFQYQLRLVSLRIINVACDLIFLLSIYSRTNLLEIPRLWVPFKLTYVSEILINYSYHCKLQTRDTSTNRNYEHMGSRKTKSRVHYTFVSGVQKLIKNPEQDISGRTHNTCLLTISLEVTWMLRPCFQLKFLFLFRTCYMPRPSQSPWFNNPDNNWWKVQIMKLSVLQFYPICSPVARLPSEGK
jgi:hypothetical protein